MIDCRSIHDIRQPGSTLTALAIALSVLPCGACSNGDVNLGDGLITQNIVAPSRCAETRRIEGRAQISNQGDLDALAGCEEVDGDLAIDLFANPDLTPLASLRRVSGHFGIGFFPFEYPSDPAEQAAIEDLEARGYLESLHGLEALESVGYLQLNSLLVQDLTELESLSSIGRRLTLYDMKKLKTLVGLPATNPSLTSIEISQCPELETLEGLALERGIDDLRLDSLPALKNVDALAQIEGVNIDLSIARTGLQALPDLPLRLVSRQLSLRGNPALADVSGLRELTFVEELEIRDNPLLGAFPELSNLTELDRLQVIGNGIQTLDLNFLALHPKARDVEDQAIEISAELVVVASNPNLERITFPASAPLVQFVSISDNQRLTDIDFGTLRSADRLSIRSNAVLERVTPSSLATVDSLEVTNNPRLAPNAFDDVQTFERSIAGNAAP